jgi:hypothetical protein
MPMDWMNECCILDRCYYYIHNVLGGPEALVAVSSAWCR